VKAKDTYLGRNNGWKVACSLVEPSWRPREAMGRMEGLEAFFTIANRHFDMGT